MSLDRIAVYGHRGWASFAIVNAFAALGTPLKVLYRKGSDISGIPSSATTVCVDHEDIHTFVSALQDVDILVSLLGHEGIKRQEDLIKAIPRTTVKLFVPSDLAFRCDDLGIQVPVNRAKRDIEQLAKNAGIPTTIVLPGCLAESSLSTTMLGIDVPRNRIVYTGNSAQESLPICTRAYVAAAYAYLFAASSPLELQNRVIGLSEMHITGNDIAAGLEKKHGRAPQVLKQSIEIVDKEIQLALESASPLALAWYIRRIWGTGDIMGTIGTDLQDVPGYSKVTLEELLTDGKLEPYRGLPQAAAAAFDAMNER